MINISICICTRKRKEGLKRLLDSLANLEAPPETEIRIIVVENDTERFSENVIEEFLSKNKFRISYYLETRQGIVFARNRSVAEAGDCDFCCFTDDDQIVTSDWLTQLLKCQREYDADGVAGPTKPYFTGNVPAHINKFHQPDVYPYGTIVRSAFTGCLLLKKRYLDLIDGPFDIRLNFSGGEDSYLTKKISDLGGVIRFNPNAIAYEVISEERATVKFVVKRSFRISNTRLFINSIDNKNYKPFKALPRLVMRFCYGSLIFIPCLIFYKAERLKGLIKIVNAVGGIAFFFGKLNQFYKK
jgi:succinoglycan biosynthesis protein ExoM